MNKIFSIAFVILSVVAISNAQEKIQLNESNNPKTAKSSFKQGEWLKFRIHYGFINAGYATLKLKQSKKNGVSLYHAIGKGWTVGAASLYFSIKDN